MSSGRAFEVRRTISEWMQNIRVPSPDGGIWRLSGCSPETAYSALLPAS
jgi:hypothetical protein